jgi:hypothetical protein
MNFLLSLLLSLLVPLSFAKPKYGPKIAPRAVPLSQDSSYFRSQNAPDFWALISYSVPQFSGAACSVASVSAVINAARARTALTSNDKLVVQEELLKKVKVADWEKRIRGGTLSPPRGVTLESLREVTEGALKAYGISYERVELLRFEGDPKEELRRLETILEENERSTRDFVIANFLQSTMTDDSATGHISPIGAFDRARKRVLVLETDREWYEPYWVSSETLLQGLRTLDSESKRQRGLIRVTLGKSTTMSEF